MLQKQLYDNSSESMFWFQEKVGQLEKERAGAEKRVNKEKHQEILLLKREIDKLRKENTKIRDDSEKRVS